MSDILIKGMEKPKNCGECFACKAELSQEKKVIYVCCFTREEYVSDENRVETDCPLVPVPTPHGRLIDADALIIDLMDRGIDGVQTDDWHEIQQAVADAPTIILAEEGET